MVLRVNVTILPELSAYLPSLLILQVSLQQQMAWPCEHANGPLPVKQGPLHAVDPRPFCFTNAVAPLGRAAQPHEEKRRRGGRLGRSLPRADASTLHPRPKVRRTSPPLPQGAVTWS